MATPAPPPDGSPAVYTRSQLLALYPSPLVPSRLEGMKELSEWYGEFTEPPSPPQPRHHLPSRPSDRSERSERGTPSRRPLQTDSSNPFTNFGRFGLGEAIEGDSGDRRRRGGERGERKGEGRNGDEGKDLAPHLGGGRRRDRENGEGGGGTSPTRERGAFFESRRGERGERDRDGGRRDRGDRERGEGRDRGGMTTMERALANEMERRKEAGITGAAGLGELGSSSRKEMRRGIGPADEGGWRNVGLSREEREKRLTRNNSSSTGLDSRLESRRNDRDRDRDRSDRDRDREGGNSRLGGGGRPSWMDDDERGGSSSSPAWMDAPTAGNLSFGTGGNVLEPSGEEKPKPKSAAAGGAKDLGGMDGIQAWKAQMKEMERREREKDLKPAGLPVPAAEEKREKDADEAQSKAQESVFDALSGGSSSGNKETKSIFEDLGITRPPPGLPLPNLHRSSSDEQPQQAGGRSSRFAKFFDGKPPTQPASSPSLAAAQPAPSVFSSLMAGMGTAGGAVVAGGGAENAPGPSKEDAESMARLLGMLQVSGAAKSSPNANKGAFDSPPSVSSPAVSAAQPPAARSSSTAGEGRSSSRFNFSKSASASAAASVVSSPQVQAQSPAVSSASGPPPPPPEFGFPLSGGPPGLASPAIDPRSPPSQARPPPPSQPSINGNAAQSPPIPHQQQPPHHPHHPQQHPNGPFSPPPPPPPGMPPQFFDPRGIPTGPGRPPFPPFALGPDGRPIPPPPGAFPGGPGGPNGAGGPPPFPSPGIPRNNGGPLSPPLSAAGSAGSPLNGPPHLPPQHQHQGMPNGFRPGQGPPGMNGQFPPGPPPPPHMMFPPNGPPPPPGYFPPPRLGPGQGPNGLPPPVPMFGGQGAGGGANPGADLMALLNSGAAGRGIGPQGGQGGGQHSGMMQGMMGAR
ncbi:hypothetical protein JCM8547_005795 [Rhodosporidiobolus lusitaniae]